MSSCPNKDFLKKYAIKCELIDNKIKCPSKKKLKIYVQNVLIFILLNAIKNIMLYLVCILVVKILECM